MPTVCVCVSLWKEREVESWRKLVAERERDRE